MWQQKISGSANFQKISKILSLRFVWNVRIRHKNNYYASDNPKTKLWNIRSIFLFDFFGHYLAEFPKWGQLVGWLVLAKWPKTAWKLKNQLFGGKIVCGHGGTGQFFG